MGVWQVRHRPRSTSQASTGTFSNQLSFRLQLVQCDAGNASDCSSGSR